MPVYAADKCPGCERSVKSGHRQLGARVYVCPDMKDATWMWRFAVDTRNNLVLLCISTRCDEKRARDIAFKSAAENRVSDGPAVNWYTLNTPMLEDPEKRMKIIPATKLPPNRPRKRIYSIPN